MLAQDFGIAFRVVVVLVSHFFDLVGLLHFRDPVQISQNQFAEACQAAFHNSVLANLFEPLEQGVDGQCSKEGA